MKEDRTLKTNSNIDFDIKKSNYILQIMVKDNHNIIQGSKSFYSKKEKDKLLSLLQKKLNEKTDETLKVKLTLINKNTKESKCAYVKISHHGDVREIIDKIKQHVVKENNKYDVCIENCSSVKSDIRRFQIKCKDTMEEVIFGLKSLLNDIIKESDKSIIFDEKAKPSTHRILVMKDKITKCFSINLPNYSSSEVKDLLIDKIRGAK